MVRIVAKNIGNVVECCSDFRSFNMSEQLVNLSQSAANKIQSLITEEGNPELKLRVYITGGGCSGFQYNFAFEENVNPDDTLIEATADDEGGEGSVGLVIDPMSFQYLIGADIDYQNDLSGEQFIIKNPNAQTTCGCGSSFSV